MSEYQYYEFQAIDRPLTDGEMRELRRVSSRAEITATRFTNHYEWGDFKGDPAKWMDRYFDAFLYVANWGTHLFSLRLPARLLDIAAAHRYCVGDAARARIAGDFTILDFAVHELEPDSDWDDGAGWLASLISLRGDLARGDLRALYLAWLLCLQQGEVAEDEPEPEIPPGLAELPAPLRALAEFFRINPDLIAAAAQRGKPLPAAPARAALTEWIAALPTGEKDAWLLRAAEGEAPQLGAELHRRFRDSCVRPQPADGSDRRTVAELLSAAEALAEERAGRQAEERAAPEARRRIEEANAREAHLDRLAQREREAWRRVDELIATRQPQRYDEAVALLRELQGVAVRDGRDAEAYERIAALRALHSKKPSLIERMERAGLP